MLRFFPVLAVVCTLVGAGLGWNSTAHYRPPAESGAERLRERAAEYYRASTLFDYLAMAQLYTPAKQIAEQQVLLESAKKYQVSFSQLAKANQAALRTVAQAISPAALEVELDGNWASTGGNYLYPAGSSEISLEFDQMVWVKSEGDWWIYTWTKPEISAYGNPPDASYKLLRQRQLEESRRLARERQQQLEAEQLALPPVVDNNDTSTGGESTLGQPGDPPEAGD